jgi:hypothetical protein
MLGLARLSAHLPSKHQRVGIAGGNVGTVQTLSHMRDLVTQGKRDFRLRTAAGKILQNCPNKDYECFARAIHQFCTHQIKYVFDPNGVELIEAPYRILESGIADCDSIVVLAAAMLESIGLPARFVTIKADTSRPTQWSHVFLQAKVPNKGWIGMDCTMPDKPFGWEPPQTYERKTWPASRDGVESHDRDEMAGLGMAAVPHVENTKGVMVGNEWNFRDESALVTATPEQIELNPLEKRSVEPIGAPRPEFFMENQRLPVAASATVAAPVVGKKLGMTLPLLLGGAFVVWLLFGRKR